MVNYLLVGIFHEKPNFAFFQLANLIIFDTAKNMIRCMIQISEW